MTDTDAADSPVLSYLRSRPFPPDDFQREAALALEEGDTVVVAAPTGSGKTLVAEAAIHLARARGQRAFYTTPIKALSNQKYGDLVAEHGAERVGLLTGDNVINGGAEIVVMTTEVLRNMIYADPDALSRVGFVILDEVHYLQDRFRGPVWEEVIIHAPREVQLLCLSATIANAGEFADWVEERRGSTTLIHTTERPVPLESLYLLADRAAGEERLQLHPTFTRRDGRTRPNQRLEHLLGLERGRRRRFATPRRTEVVEKLADEGMLPAIYFIFSRAGCDAAALSVVEAGLRLTEPDTRDRIRQVAEERTAHLSDRDLAALEYGRWLAGLEAGVAAHHAGMVPAFKETVEELFAAGLLRVVFATETLALGINMPARTVVLESLSKFDGEGHSLLEPGDYTQLTGRAGRRGIDTRGYGVVLHSRYVPFDQVTRIASAGAHPLRSSFRPTYNMAANLVANYSEEEAEQLLTASFAQYQREGSETARQETLREMETRLVDEMARAECERGSVSEYFAEVERRQARSDEGMAGRLQPGDVIDVPAGSRAGRYAVLRRIKRGKKGQRFLVLGTSGRTSPISAGEIVPGSRRVTTLELPRPHRGKDRKLEQQLLRKLRRVPPAHPADTVDVHGVDHPVADCPDAAQHLRWYRKALRTQRRITQLRNQLRAAGVGLVEEFGAIRELLEDWGYLDGWSLTPRGERLRFVYNEMDLFLTEAAERGLLWSLEPRDLAGLASCFVFEPRSDQPPPPRWPNPELEARYDQLIELWEELTASERQHRLAQTRRPEPGFVAAAVAWASDQELEDLPNDARLAPGDFVRVSRQLVDLLRQLRDTFPELADDARAALAAIDRGVVAAQGVG